MPKGVFTNSEERSRKISAALRGKKRTLEMRKATSVRMKKKWADHCYRELQSEAHKGNAGFWTGKRRPDISGENNRVWVGNKVSYRALHSWVARWLGKPQRCTVCGKEQSKTGKAVHWANRTGNYLRDLSDWISLCAKCHRAHDKDGGYSYAYI